MKQETVSGSGISWAICKSAPRPRQISTPASNHSFFTGQMSFLPSNEIHKFHNELWIYDAADLVSSRAE